ncbi:MAG: ATP-binding cassette domain-containing protein, partial [Alphaproteobacteria bacterium]
MPKLLEIENLWVDFQVPMGPIQAVNGISYAVDTGETVAVVGESGCGKSVSALAILGLVPSPPGRVADGSIRFEGRDLLGLAEDEIRLVRGREIAMVFQEPMTSLNPVLNIGVQVTEAMQRHLGLTRKQAMDRAIELLVMVGISEPERRL